MSSEVSECSYALENLCVLLGNRVRELDVNFTVIGPNPNNNEECGEQCRKLPPTDCKVDMPKNEFLVVTEAIGEVLEACPFLEITDACPSLLSIVVIRQQEQEQEGEQEGEEEEEGECTVKITLWD